jgi:hypothetical protein
MKKITILAMGVLFVSGTLYAQDPEIIAKRETDRISQQLNLNDKQYKKIYKLNLKEAKARISEMEKANSRQSNNDFGMRPQGMGGGPGGGGMPGMGDQGGRMGNSQGPGMRSGMRPEMSDMSSDQNQGGMIRSESGKSASGPNGMMNQKAMSNGPKADDFEKMEEQRAKRDAKYKKILTPEQFMQWTEIENERMSVEFKKKVEREMSGKTK